MVGGLGRDLRPVPRDRRPVPRRQRRRPRSATRCASTDCRRWCSCSAASSACCRALYGVGYLRRNEARGLVTPRHAPRVLRPDPGLRVRDAARLGVEQPRHPLDRRRADDAGVGVPGHVPRPRHVARGGLEVPGARQPRPRVRAARHGAAVRRRPGAPRRGHVGAPLDAVHGGRAAACTRSRCGSAWCSRSIGYGTKAGLAPMHTWKPDAYREAPSPAGVLMAVGMLNGAAVLPPADPPDLEGGARARSSRAACCWRSACSRCSSRRRSS